MMKPLDLACRAASALAVARIGRRRDVAMARHPGQRQLEREEDVPVPEREPDLAAVVEGVALEAGEVGRVDARESTAASPC